MPVASAFAIPAAVVDQLRQTFGEPMPEGVTLETSGTNADAPLLVKVTGLLSVATVDW